ncbi:glycosyltransferase family 4 protein [Candidatus Micrarchaeota archaeon]|nr:glycosyltransferase family 4 protein [Candidatus Micrarchaeota archaeon]
MRILLMNPFFHPYYGGTEKHLLEVGKRLAKKHEISILTARLDGTEEKEEVYGINIIREPAKVYYSAPHPLPPPVPIFKNHKKYLAEAITSVDLVHTHNRFTYMPSDAHLIKKHGKKLCLTLHNARPQNIDAITDIFGGLFDDIISKKFMYQCDGIAAVSNATLNSTLPSDYKGIKKVIYNGVDEKLFRPMKNNDWKDKLGIKEKMILTNVRLLPQKGLYYLISAMKKIHNAELVIFGRGQMKRELEIHAKKINVKVHFVTERITDAQLVKLYGSADCFTLPSLYEPCSVALIEAMACAKPIVATDAGGNKELIENWKGGIIVPTRDSDSLANAINKILNNKKLATKFSQFNRKRVLKGFTWDIVAKNVELFYKSLW